MEKQLSREELLRTLINRAIDPFSTCEQKNDIQRILEESDSFGGKNHIFLVQSYLRHDENIFKVDRKKAIDQAFLAMKEGNPYSCYFLFHLLKDTNPTMARNYLRLACDHAIPEAYLEIARCKHHGILFTMDRKGAFIYYQKAGISGLKEGYDGMLIMACEDHDIKLQNKVKGEALIHGFELMGTIE